MRDVGILQAMRFYSHLFFIFSQVLGPACVQGRLASQRKSPSNERKKCNEKIFFLQVLGQACMQIGSGLVLLQSQMKAPSRKGRRRGGGSGGGLHLKRARAIAESDERSK
jgi:hypothetical protein